MPAVNRFCSLCRKSDTRREVISPFMLPLRQLTGLGLSVFKLFCAENHTPTPLPVVNRNRRSLLGTVTVAPALRRL